MQTEKMVHKEVVTIQKTESISKMVKLMKDYGYSQVQAFDGKQSVGSILEKTILRQILAGKDLEQISALSTKRLWRRLFHK